VATGAVSKTNDLASEQAFDLATAGLEYALKRIDEGANPDGDVRYLGAGRFTIAYDDSTGLITSTSDVSALFGSSNQSFSIEGPTSGSTMADCLEVDVSGARMNTIWWPYEIIGANLINTCTNNITLAAMTVSWTPVSTDHAVIVAIGGTTVYQSYSPGTPSGGVIDINDYTIGASSSVAQTRIRFNTELPNRNFNIVYTMSDGSSKNAMYQFRADDESACLEADLSAAYVGWTGNTRLIGGMLANVCSAPTVIGIKGMRVSWTPLSPVRTLSNVFIDGAQRWSGSVTSGTEVIFGSIPLFNPGQSMPQNYLTFSGEMSGRNFIITYIMRDDTELTVPVNLYADDMAACLLVDTSGMTISAREVRNQLWVNACPLGIVVDRVTTSWTGLAANRRLDRIRVDGSDRWSGSATNGTNVDITDVQIGGASTSTVNYYRFRASAVGGCFSHIITMLDGTTKSVPSYCP
jgi:hypothetical protein